jgi:hypothetical protein
MPGDWIMKIIVAILILFISPAQAYFKDMGVGARPLGMGGAYTAIADDGNAVLWNSSGLAQLEKRELTAMFSAIYVGLDAKLYNEKTDQLGYHFICYAHPSSLGSFAISWSTFQSQLYDENIFCFSYGRMLTENLCAGLNLKNMGWKVGENEFTRMDKDIPSHGVSVSGFTLDLSSLYKSDDGLSVGLSAENLIPADVGLKAKEEIPLNLRFGIAYRIDNFWYKNINLLPAMDIIYRSGEGSSARIGGEAWFFDETLSFRAGWNSTSATSGLSYRFVSRQWEIQVDYGFVYSFLIQQNYGTHRTSLSIRF